MTLFNLPSFIMLLLLFVQVLALASAFMIPSSSNRQPEVRSILSSSSSSLSFWRSPSTTTTSTTSVHLLPEERQSDYPPEENIENVSNSNNSNSNIDWDAEWKKVVANQNQPTQRPGKDFYKSDAEIAAIKAANRAQREMEKLRPPSFQSLQGDWKFWIAVLAIISVGASVLSAGGSFSQPPVPSGSDSYYI